MNRNTASRMALAMFLIAGVAGLSAAQGRRGAGTGSPGYDAAAERTIQGSVVEVQSNQARRGGTGVHLIVKTVDATVDVHVGPTRWLADQHYDFAVGDSVEVTGAPAKVGGADTFIARVIVKGDVTMTLRAPTGIPRWSRRGGGTR